MSMTSEEFWMGEARKFESWFYQANYARVQQEAENAKLRELVDELWSLAYGYVPHESELDAVRDMMRELGVDE